MASEVSKTKNLTAPQHISMPSVSVFMAIMSSYSLVDELAEDYVHQYYSKSENGQPTWFDDYCGLMQAFETGDGDEETVLRIPSLQQLPLIANIINPTWRLEAIANKSKDFPTRLPPVLRSMAVQLKKHNECRPERYTGLPYQSSRESSRPPRGLA